MRSVVTRLQRLIKFETVEMMLLQQRTAASTAYSSVTKARALQCLPSAVTAAQGQRVSSVWRDAAPARQLHISSIPRAAATEADLGDDLRDEEVVYPLDNIEDTFNYTCYACVTGTVMGAKYQEGTGEREPWLCFALMVPTPNHDDFTKFHVMANGRVAELARQHAQEGAYLQVGGNFLPPASLRATQYGYVLGIPAVYATGIGYFDPETTNPEDLAARLNITVLPQISETEIERFINSGGLQWQPNLKWPPPEAMPAAGAPGAAARAPAPAAGVPMAAAEPIWADGMPASPEQAGNETEAAWVTLFLENHLWVDQRETKRGKQPDFRLRARGTDRDGSGRPDALWIQDWKTPSWVKRSLQLLPGGKGYELKPFIPADALQGTPAEQQWVQVFENYGQFWDNRANKKNPRAPDFSPKDRETGGQALWLTSRDTPEWVKDNLHELPAPPLPR